MDGVTWFKDMLEGRFKIKYSILGSKPGLEKEGRILNRIIRVTDNGWEYEADQRHAEILINEMGFEANTKSVVTPGVKMSADDIVKWEEPISEGSVTRYRACAARAMYLAQDRSDIGYAVKEVFRGMAAPTEGDLSNLKRLC